jgi:hypothetical protein
MTPFLWAATFGTACIVAATVIALVCLRAFALENAAEEAAHEVPAEPHAPWALFDAPEFREALTDYLDAVDAHILRHFEETARAEAAQLDDEDAVARWLEATS